MIIQRMNSKLSLLRVKSITNILTMMMMMVVISRQARQDFCKMPDCEALHVACDYWQQRQDPSCPRRTTNIPVNLTLQKHILHFHNTERNRVAGGGLGDLPRAARMATMRWDDTLSQLAQIKALHCNVIPDHCHPTDRFRYSGQMLSMVQYHSADRKVPLYKIVDMNLRKWLRGAALITQADIDGFPANASTEILAYALLINERNTNVGCGLCQFRVGHENRAVFVCDYATQNFIGLPTYQTSKTAGSGCKRKNLVYTNLCSPSEKYNYKPMASLKAKRV